jgi:hypothetical protein
VDSRAGSNGDRYPIRVTFFGCCASAATPKPSTSVATKIDDEPTFFIPHLVADAITRTVIAETIIYGGRETGFVDRERAKFRRWIELNDATDKSHRIGEMEKSVQSYRRCVLFSFT